MSKPHRSPLAEFDEPDVVGGLAAGDADELRRLYLKAFPVMSARVRRLFGGGVLSAEEAEEVANNALVKANLKITTSFDTGREGKLSALLFKIVVNEAKDYLRWRKAPNRDPLDRPSTSSVTNIESLEGALSESMMPSNVIPPVEGRMPEDKLSRLRAAALRIPPGERRAVVRQTLWENLSEVERNVLSWRLESSDREIAKELEISEGNVRKIRSEALKKWVESLESWTGTDER